MSAQAQSQLEIKFDSLMKINQLITPCLWFNDEAEEAAVFYTGIFDHSRITAVSRYTEAGHDIHNQRAGQVMVVAFELNGQPFTALNGGPHFKINEAISFQVQCDTQERIDYFWEQLGAGGDPAAQQCGWLKDKFGVSWQIVPTMIAELLSGADPEATQRATEALLQMKKLDIAELRRAYNNHELRQMT